MYSDPSPNGECSLVRPIRNIFVHYLATRKKIKFHASLFLFFRLILKVHLAVKNFREKETRITKGKRESERRCGNKIKY